ncbi:MAG: sulfite exporter TauE/SafE family protein [Proteobacteria bacterium]|nr:sulfite exporter TauE/SafE family protein [Pseudomonadota bacterium]
MFESLFAYLSSAFLLGVSHSLQPGHGKTTALTFGTDLKRNWVDLVILSFSAAAFQLALLLFLGLVLQWSLFSFFKTETKTIFALGAAGLMALWGIVETIRASLQYHFRNRHPVSPSECSLMKKPWLHKILERSVISRSRYFSSFLVGLSIGLIPCPVAFSGLMTSLLSKGMFAALIYSSMFCLGIGSVLLFCASSLRWPLPFTKKLYVSLLHFDDRHPYALSFMRGIVLLFTALSLFLNLSPA